MGEANGEANGEALERPYPFLEGELGELIGELPSPLRTARKPEGEVFTGFGEPFPERLPLGEFSGVAPRQTGSRNCPKGLEDCVGDTELAPQSNVIRSALIRRSFWDLTLENPSHMGNLALGGMARVMIM